MPEKAGAMSHHGAPRQSWHGSARPPTLPLAGSRRRAEGKRLPQGRAFPWGWAGPGRPGGPGAAGRCWLLWAPSQAGAFSRLPPPAQPLRPSRGAGAAAGSNASARHPSALCHPPCPSPVLIRLLPCVSCRPRRLTAKQEF